MKSLRVLCVLVLMMVPAQPSFAADFFRRAAEQLVALRTAAVNGACGLAGIRVKPLIFNKSECDQWLADQNYTELAQELRELLDSGVAGLQLQVHGWILDRLQQNLDPILLYMDVRHILKNATSDGEVYRRTLTHFIFCIVMADLAKRVLLAMARTESEGHQMEEIARYLKAKFVHQYGRTTFTSSMRNCVNFTEVRNAVIAHLRSLAGDAAAMVALPLPFWALRTRCGWTGGWGMTWPALNSDELGIRKTQAVIGSIVQLTRQALVEIIEHLSQQSSWDVFLGLGLDDDCDFDDEAEDDDKSSATAAASSSKPHPKPAPKEEEDEGVVALDAATAQLSVRSGQEEEQQQRRQQDDNHADEHTAAASSATRQPTAKPGANTPGGKSGKK